MSETHDEFFRPYDCPFCYPEGKPTIEDNIPDEDLRKKLVVLLGAISELAFHFEDLAGRGGWDDSQIAEETDPVKQGVTILREALYGKGKPK